MTVKLHNAMIIIAVSKYPGGKYDDLPGTLHSADRLRKWAEAKSPDRNYNVLTIDDKEDDVTADRVEHEIKEFLASNIIDRLVVYFGGHGAQQKIGQFWLLSNAGNDTGQAINFNDFKEGLRKSNIGGLNRKIDSGQVWIISDACRNPDIGFSGRAILTTGRRTKNVEFDIYHSCLSEDYSFHLDPTTERDYPHLLFTEALVDTLEGAFPDTIETEFHQHSPAMLNHLVAKFLRREVPARGVAYSLEQETEPDINTGFSPPHNYYVAPINPGDPSEPASGPTPPPPSGSTSMAGDAIQARMMSGGPLAAVEQLGRIRALRRELNRLGTIINAARTQLLNDETLLLFSNRAPDAIAAPAAMQENVTLRKIDDSFAVIGRRWRMGVPLLYRQDDDWIISPVFPNASAVLVPDILPKDFLLFRDELGTPEVLSRKLNTSTWDSSWSDTFIQKGDNPLRMSEANHHADSMRALKHTYPHHAVTAAYLYEKSGDYENILRTAHYLAEDGPNSVPFDLALLCATNIEWKHVDGQVIAVADFPAVRERKKNESEAPYDAARPEYTRRGFASHKSVELLGFVPSNGRGWSILKYIEEFVVPKDIRQIAQQALPRTTGVVSMSGADVFMNTFGYQNIGLRVAEDAAFEIPLAEELPKLAAATLPNFLAVTQFEEVFALVEAKSNVSPESNEFWEQFEKLRLDATEIELKLQ